jgi:hypothetical protein
VLWCNTATTKYLCGALLSNGYNVRVLVPKLSGAVDELEGYEDAIITMPDEPMEYKKLFFGT